MPRATDPVGTTRGPAWWRDAQQGTELAEGDISPFFARVSFAKLRRGATDNRAVPKRGPINRILASRFETGQGVDYGVVCFFGRGECTGPYRGRLQPYSIYVPQGPKPRRGWGLTLLMHSLAAAYNQYAGSKHQRQFGERGPGSITITPEARGPDGGYDSYALADVFEVWADVARRYRLDPAWTVTSGYSMGGFGSFDIAEQFPDLFARLQSTVGAQDTVAGGATRHQLASLRNIPVLMWNGVGDELVPPSSYLPAAQELDDLGYRYELDQFVPGEHLSLAINDEYGPAADFLGTARVNRNPFHVTYVVDPAEFERKLRVVADHAYWLSRLRARGGGYGTIDAISRGFGQADPPVSPTADGHRVPARRRLPRPLSVHLPAQAMGRRAAPPAGESHRHRGRGHRRGDDPPAPRPGRLRRQARRHDRRADPNPPGGVRAGNRGRLAAGHPLEVGGVVRADQLDAVALPRRQLAQPLLVS